MDMKPRSLINACVLGLCALSLWTCREKTERELPAFRPLKIEKAIPLARGNSSPACNISLDIDEIADTTQASLKMNQAIAQWLFGGWNGTLASTADSFCSAYGEQYRKELAVLYRADQQHGVNASWYEYKYQASTEYKSGLNGCLCFTIHISRYEGGAREYIEEKCLNFDTRTGKRVTLEDVLTPASQTLLPALLLEELMKAYDCQKEEELHGKGILRLTDIYVPANYELGRDGITFVYIPGEIAAYETGTIRLFVPYARLETLTGIIK